MHGPLNRSGSDDGRRAPRHGRILAVLAAFIVLVAAVVAVRVLARAEAERTPEPLPVATATVDLVDTRTREVWYTGRLRAARQSELGFERRARLMAVRVEDGERVAAGEVLARLDISTLQRRRKELVARRESTRAELELARRTEKRQKRLLAQGHASQQRYDEAHLEAQALAAQVDELSASIASIDLDIAKSTLQAPYAGRIQVRHRDPGTVVAPGEPIVTLVESGAPEARIGVPPKAAETLTVGERYALTVNGDTVPGRLRALTPELSPQTRTVTAVFELAHGANGAAFGEVVRLSCRQRVPGRGAWLPRSALSEDIRGLWSVLALHEDPKNPGFVLKRETVEVIEIDGERVFATGSVNDGRRIVADGVNRVVPGQHVVPAEDARRASKRSGGSP